MNKRFLGLGLARIAFALTLMLGSLGQAVASTITVSNLADSQLGSLRSAVSNALDGDTILFAPALSGKVMVLTNGSILFDKDVTIDGSGLASRIRIDGNHANRIFQVDNQVTVVLKGLILTNGYENGSSGGAIYNQGTLTVEGTTVVGSSAGTGGGIYNSGRMALTNSTVAGNSAESLGGGIYNYGTLTLSQTTLSQNNSAVYGGGIENNGDLMIVQSTFTRNSSGGGGAIDNNSLLIANQSTFVGNSITSDDGGAIWAGGSVAVTNCTIARNSALAGTAGIAQYASSPILLFNSVVAQNTNGNFGGSFTGGRNLTSGDPMLAPLGDYGGPTQTMPPLPGSPAVDAASDTVTNCFTTDQRGAPRRAGLHVDIGAAELQGVSVKLTRLINGAMRLTFASQTGEVFTVLASTTVSAPANGWLSLGAAVESPSGSGQYQFTDQQATNNPQRFYRVRKP